MVDVDIIVLYQFIKKIQRKNKKSSIFNIFYFIYFYSIKMDYFIFIPNEIVEIIISKLDNRQLINFIDLLENSRSSSDPLKNINWRTIYSYYFNKSINKDLNYREYIKILSLIRLKNELKLKASTEELFNLIEINFRLMNLFSLPIEIGALINLKILILSNNNLSSVPSEIGLLTNLQFLFLNDNKLLSIPPEIGRLKNLDGLLLYNNKLSSIPAQVGELESLRTLDLKNNLLSFLPDEIGQLKNIILLDLEYNFLSKKDQQKIIRLLPCARIKFYCNLDD